MKKIALATILSLVSAVAFAGSASLEYQSIDGKNATPDQRATILTVREDITKNFRADVSFVNVKNEDSNTISYRTEVGGTGLMPVGKATAFVRTAVGQRFTSTTNYSYYVVEPGIRMPLASTGLTASLSYRYRDAFDNANGDQTHSVRTGLSYALTKQDAIGVAYMKTRGDAQQSIIGVNYTRGF